MVTRFRLSKKVSALGSLVLIFIVTHSIIDLRTIDVTDIAKLAGYGANVKPDLVEEAHRLSTANSFLPHFKAVTQIQNLTLAEAKTGCSWSENENVFFQFGKDVDWVKQDRSDHELALRRGQWQHFISNDLLPYNRYKGRFKGRGIVIVGGNEGTLVRVRVILNALASLGSRLPVEIHYWADEMSEESKVNMTALWPEIYFTDLSASSNILQTKPGYFKGRNYQFKTAALLNSRFAEPLLLDSDNIPVVDPESLYETSIYKTYGTLFWPDISRTRANNPMWGITNTKCQPDEWEQESGQLLVDKRKFFYHLQLAAWFGREHGDYYNEFLLGDKDLFRFAWHALKTKYGFPAKWVTSVGTLADNFYCGHTFAQHHPNGSVAFMHGGLLKTMAKPVMAWQRESRGGIYQVYKRSDQDERHSNNIDVRIRWDTADYMPNRPDGLPLAWCTDFDHMEARPLDEIAPGFEKTFEAINGYSMFE